MKHARTLALLVGLLCPLVCVATGSTDVPGDWTGSVVENIHRFEYRFSDLEDGRWSAPNRAHDLRSFVSADGLTLVPRRPAERPWQIDLRLVGYGRRDSVGPIASAVAIDGRADGGVALDRQTLVEWYVNRPFGLEQGFTLPAAPAGATDAEVVLEMRVVGAVMSLAGDDVVEFRSASGRDALHYDKLVVVDASGARLPAWIEAEGDRLRLVFEDHGAVYPVVVDPTVTDPDWSAEGNQASSAFGVSVASAGDVNGDGFDDVIVGADEFDNVELDEGAVFVYYGSPTGPSVTPSWVVESNHNGSGFGQSVASAGDVNNDGYDDIAIGASEFDDFDPLQSDEGWAFVFYGSPTGLPNGPFTTIASANWTAQGDETEADFARRVASAGDVNNDGFDDLIIGAPDSSNDQAFEGKSFVFHGSATGLDPGGRPIGRPSNADWETEGDQVTCLYSHVAESAGDVNNDGFGDVIVGARQYQNNFDDEGRVYLYLGSGAGLSTTPVWIYEGGQNDMRLGVSVDGAGDVNGDGFDDVIIGADIYSNGQTGEGAAFVFAGNATGQLGSVPAWVAEINQGDAFFGFSSSGAGDVNNDGFDDVIVGADSFENGELGEGSAFLYLGSPNGLPDAPSRSFEVDQPGARLGTSVAGAGDTNGDNFDEVIVGADLFTKLQVDEGGAFVYFGCQDDERDGVCDLEDNCPELFNPGQEDNDLDGIGNDCDPCEDVDLDTVCDVPRVLVEWAGPGEEVLVQEGSVMRYLANVETINPGIILEWTELTFPAELSPPWAIGVYGVGYETDVVGGAHDLFTTTVAPGTISIFTRSQFVIDDVTAVDTLFLGVEWDDAFIAWINGVEVFRSPQMPGVTPLWNTKPIAGHESSNGPSPVYEPLQDISFNGIPALKNGLNVLAIGVWNTSQNSSDLVLVPRLSINRPKVQAMHYLANVTDPGLVLQWTETGYDEQAAGWTPGNFGVGYETGIGAEDLINTNVDPNALSVYARARFNVDPTTVDSVFLGADYDNAYVAWINGAEIHRSPEMPGVPGSTPAWNEDPPATHESSNGAVPDYGVLVDVTSQAEPVMFEGENVLTVGVWNSSTDTDDLVLVPRLSINEGSLDNCVGTFNPDQADLDADGLGDACDPDIDGDGFNNGVDNCPLIANDQSDLDTDGQGDVCDVCPDDAADDFDLDGICAGSGFNAPKVGDQDNCPVDANAPSDCDGSAGTPDEQCDLDGDGLGDVCDPDVDGDTVDNDVDNCPLDPNGTQTDTDSDLVGDACDCSAGNNQAWAIPEAIDTLLVAKNDLCGNFACSESAGACGLDSDCNFDSCEGFACSLSSAPCGTNADCEQDTCGNFLCTAGANACGTDADCTADFCAGRTCTAGLNGCTGDVDCTADTCQNKTCLVTGGSCFSHFDCFGGAGDLCIGACSVGGNLCADDGVCTADVCGDGTCSVGSNVCSDDIACTADVCEGTCSVGANTCLTDGQCTAPQVDLCEGACSIGLNVCTGDVDCTVPQTDLCLGACTIGANACSSDAACNAPSVDTLFWLEPAENLGGTGVVYDTLRSTSSIDFVTPAVCVETNDPNRATADATQPASGSLLYYLIRIENECPDGNLGSGANGPRTGKACN